MLFYGQEDGLLAGQLLVLSPGRYRLALRVGGEAARATTLKWTVSCVRSGQVLLSLALSDAKRAAQGVQFDVPPADCGAQNLQLTGSAPELPQQADVTVSGLSLIRVAGNG